jgi:hypothetical protein
VKNYPINLTAVLCFSVVGNHLKIMGHVAVIDFYSLSCDYDMKEDVEILVMIF